MYEKAQWRDKEVCDQRTEQRCNVIYSCTLYIFAGLSPYTPLPRKMPLGGADMEL